MKTKIVNDVEQVEYSIRYRVFDYKYLKTQVVRYGTFWAVNEKDQAVKTAKYLYGDLIEILDLSYNE